jgi:hypothetical protein
MTISEGVPASITTPDTVKTRLGALEFRDGALTPETAERLYHHLLPRHPREPLLVGDGLRPPDPLGTADLPAVPQPGQPNRHRRTEPRWLHRPVPRAPPGRQHNWIQTIQAEAGSQSCASTAPSSPSSTRAGGPARPNPRTSAPTDSDDAQTGHRPTQSGERRTLGTAERPAAPTSSPARSSPATPDSEEAEMAGQHASLFRSDVKVGEGRIRTQPGSSRSPAGGLGETAATPVTGQPRHQNWSSWQRGL